MRGALDQPLRHLAPGDVVRVDFPTFDPALAGGPKERPAVVVSSREFMGRDGDVILCPITTTAPRTFDMGINWRAAGLPMSCRVRPKPTTLPRRAVTRRAGTLVREDWDRLILALLRALAVSEGPVRAQ